MRFTSLTLLLSAASSALAFSNGTLLPGYLCGVPGDGLPKSLGGVMQYFTSPKEAAQVIAKYHNQNSTMAQTGLAKTTSTITTIAPGAQVPLTVSSLGTDPNAHLIGLLLFATDSNGQKMGEFTTVPGSMTNFPACAPPGSNAVVGIVHSSTLDDVNTQTPTQQGGIVWTAPAVMFSQTVTFTGLAVTETGFGFHSTTFQTTGATGMPAAGSFMANAPMPQRVLKCFPKGQVPPGLLGQMVNVARGTALPIQVLNGNTVVAKKQPPMPPVMGNGQNNKAAAGQTGKIAILGQGAQGVTGKLQNGNQGLQVKGLNGINQSPNPVYAGLGMNKP
ncbi:hypothetical protein BC830DRAFT_1152792 [Chytriomyces sp. MP71]|nr:hypothetical protein BC830DRAFT_1152792 [Chytriomyces sp. MP71]